MSVNILESIISSFLSFANSIYNSIFSNVNFSVLWSWLPSDIGSAAAAFISVLFGLALIKGIRTFLPF